MSLLLEVSKNNHQEVLNILHENPDDVFQTDNNGNTSLHIASEKGYYQIVKTLIKNGSKINAQNKCPGWTAVHFAAYEGHVEILELLLDSGAKPNLKDWQGDTAETWALDWENYKCAMLLADATKKVSPGKNKYSQSSTKESSEQFTPEDESNADTFDSDDDSDDDDEEELTHWVIPLPQPIPLVASSNRFPSTSSIIPVSQSSKDIINVPQDEISKTDKYSENNSTAISSQTDAEETQEKESQKVILSSENEIDLSIPEEVSPEFEILEQNVPKVMSMIVELPEPDEDEAEPEQKSDVVSDAVIVEETCPIGNDISATKIDIGKEEEELCESPVVSAAPPPPPPPPPPQPESLTGAIKPILRNKEKKPPHPLHVGAEPNIHCDLIKELKSFTSGINSRKRNSARKQTPEPDEYDENDTTCINDLCQDEHKVQDNTLPESVEEINLKTEDEKQYQQEISNTQHETKSMTPGTENTSELGNGDESVPFESIVDRIKNSLKPRVDDAREESYCEKIESSQTSLEKDITTEEKSEVVDQEICKDLSNINQMNEPLNQDSEEFLTKSSQSPCKQEDNNQINQKDVEIMQIKPLAPLARVSPSPAPIPVQEVQPLGATSLPITSTPPNGANSNRRRSSNGESNIRATVGRGNDVSDYTSTIIDISQSPRDIRSPTR